MILWSLNHDFQIISDKLKKVKNVMIVIPRLCIFLHFWDKACVLSLSQLKMDYWARLSQAGLKSSQDTTI